MIKELTITVNKYKNIINLEIENTKKIMEARMKTILVVQEKLQMTNNEANKRILNVINTFSKTTNKLAELEEMIKIKRSNTTRTSKADKQSKQEKEN